MCEKVFFRYRYKHSASSVLWPLLKARSEDSWYSIGWNNFVDSQIYICRTGNEYVNQYKKWQKNNIKNMENNLSLNEPTYAVKTNKPLR